VITTLSVLDLFFQFHHVGNDVIEAWSQLPLQNSSGQPRPLGFARRTGLFRKSQTQFARHGIR